MDEISTNCFGQYRNALKKIKKIKKNQNSIESNVFICVSNNPWIN